MSYEKIVTAYDTDEHAEQAMRALIAGGFSSSESSLAKRVLVRLAPRLRTLLLSSQPRKR